MNKMIKILLSVMTFFIYLLIIPLIGYSEKSKAKPMVAQEIEIKVIEKNNCELVDEIPISSNFEIDIATEEMNQKMIEIENITDKGEWFITYKNIIDEYSHIIDPPETIYDHFTEEELELLFRVVQAEVGDEYSFEQKVNVVNVIYNRLDHECFPNKLSEILIPGQFETMSNERYKNVDVSDKTILACEYAYLFDDTTQGSLFFDSNKKLKYEPVFEDGAHNFYTLKTK
ncbi:cell wall hydrolase [Acetatifactor muris]|uniref:Cell Wall Hydrolase n=1 Tax=Acetatifactor muris TaxID=879566 RepID=A0A2K4ZM58_9FIRM|nr:cell wall hydrolase [Acetatifactor muris]MCR2049726.1 cell wall hydrolase [Acetatifactor muris]SOY31472.1 Cell Wall Hydrolase [Acetatifactor muris]